MTTLARRQAPVLLPFILLLLGGCAGTGSGPETSGTFPVPEEIEDNVELWRNVYATWSRGQVVFHDDEYMGVIYEVAKLPGPTRAGYTPEQKQFVRAKTAYYKSRLETLEAKVSSGRSLTRNERALHEKIVDAAGSRALVGAHERVRSQRGLRERFHRGLAISGRYDPAFREIFRSKGLPEDLAYLPHVESSFQVNAHSSAGAAGVWQFTRGTGKIYMTVNHAVDERLDPVVAAEGAARYLGDAHRKLGSWPLAVTSYNHGQGGMKKAKSIYGDDLGRIVRHYKGRYFGFASRNFYAEFLAAREVAGNPKKYFPEGVNYKAPLSEDRLVLRHSMPVHHLARHYGLSTYQLNDLNMAWREPARQGRLYLPAGSSVWLPDGSLQRVAAHPAPAPVLVAKAEPRVKVKKTKTVARAKQSTKPAKTKKTKKVAKLHVVKPNETLYRVAVRYNLSITELRRLNRLGPKDNTIRPGQRLRVSS
ncbi:MAG: transglycosylase SLT domain-containing protein [Pseudomonadota bacterium]|nr:transglycosylase SLT domain-containing protein [Pseudomonadota bacterium]